MYFVHVLSKRFAWLHLSHLSPVFCEFVVSNCGLFCVTCFPHVVWLSCTIFPTAFNIRMFQNVRSILTGWRDVWQCACFSHLFSAGQTLLYVLQALVAWFSARTACRCSLSLSLWCPVNFSRCFECPTRVALREINQCAWSSRTVTDVFGFWYWSRKNNAYAISRNRWMSIMLQEVSRCIGTRNA